MPARKAVSKKKKSTARKKSAAKPAVRKKTASKKKAKATTARKAPAKKKKKPTSKKTASRRTTKTTGAAKKKAAQKSVTKGKKATKKAESGKTVKTKKAAVTKATGKKPAARKSTSKKTAAPAPAKTRAKAPARKAAGASAAVELKASTNLLNGPLRGFSPYQPRRGEDYMSDGQLTHFREILLAWKRELMEEVDRTVLHMKDDAANFPDPNDRATQESEFGLELRTRDRERKLLRKINSALARIDDGSYGYCEETGDEIGLRRLEARPVATLCVEAQERRELAERQFRDREDYYR